MWSPPDRCSSSATRSRRAASWSSPGRWRATSTPPRQEQHVRDGVAARSGILGTYAEIDRVAWFAPDEARVRIKDAQAVFIDRLEALLKRG